jgi:glutaredoxin-related protein
MSIFLCDMTTSEIKTKVTWNYDKMEIFFFVEWLKSKFTNFRETKITFYPLSKEKKNTLPRVYHYDKSLIILKVIN